MAVDLPNPRHLSLIIVVVIVVVSGLGVQALYGLMWGARIDARVEALEKRLVQMEERGSRTVPLIDQRLSQMEMQFAITRRVLWDARSTLDRIAEKLSIPPQQREAPPQ